MISLGALGAVGTAVYSGLDVHKSHLPDFEYSYTEFLSYREVFGSFHALRWVVKLVSFTAL